MEIAAFFGAFYYSSLDMKLTYRYWLNKVDVESGFFPFPGIIYWKGACVFHFDINVGVFASWDTTKIDRTWG